MNINSLPTELNYKIFSFLDLKDLETCNQVNKQFNECLKNEYFWNELLPSVNEHTVSSIDAVINRIRSFFEQYLKDDKVYEYQVKFPFISDCKIDFKFGPGTLREHNAPSRTEKLFYVRKHAEKGSPDSSGRYSGYGRFVDYKIDLPNSMHSSELFWTFIKAEHS